MSLSQYGPASTLTHTQTINCTLKERTLRRRQTTREGDRTEEDSGAQMKSGVREYRPQFTKSSSESANHSEGAHQLVCFFPTRGRENERRGGQVHMKAVEINTSLSPQQ